MIISKRNHLEKMEMAKPLKHLIDELTTCPLKELPTKLKANLVWERPRGDLFHWVSVLNRFDEIFENQIQKYGLDQESPKLQEISQEGQELIISCLNFTYLLLEHCSNRSIYSSSDRIFQLLNTPTVDVRLSALEVAVSIAERYAQTNSNKYAAPKSVKLKVLQIAKSFPPPIPPHFNYKHNQNENETKKDDKATIIGDHYSFLDTITTKKKYPSKWRQLNFQYYKSILTSHPKESNNDVNNTKDSKNYKEFKPKAKSSTASKSKSKNIKEKLIPQEGLATFNLSEDTIRKLSLEQIFDRASEVILKEQWFVFGLTVSVVKSFNTKSYESIKLREKLLRTKCLAIAFICCMCPSEFTSSRLFESEPYIFSFLVDLVQPENCNEVPKDVYFCAVKALECISLKRVWGSDIVRCMGGNVSHGTLFQCIRHINKKVRSEDDDCFERGYIHFFNMLGNLIDSKSLIPRLTAGGILNDLMSFFNVKTKYRWSCSAAIHLITVLLTASPESFDDFVNNDGFKKLIDTIRYEVNFALENLDYGGGPPKESLVYYSITFRQANYIRNLMKLVVRLIHSDSGDRLRNLFDSPLLQNFNQILNNPKVFGPLILSSTIDSVFYIIHNEPTAFSILNEAKVIDTILDNYESLFLPSCDLLMSLAEVLGAICLNNDGLKKIIDKRVIESYFKSFYNLDYAKELVRSDMTTNLGCSFDELGRHYPALKPIILKEIRILIDNITPYANERLDSIRYYSSENGTLYHGKNESIIENDNGCKEIENWETTDAAYIIDNVLFFLGGLLQDSGQWGADAMKEIKYESWISFLTLSNSPFDFTTSNGISTLMGILKYFDDENRDYGLPVLFSILKKQIESPLIQGYINYADADVSYFERFENNVEAGTMFLKDLNLLNTLMYTLNEIYVNPGLMFHERYHQITDLFGGYGLKVINDFGLLLKRSAIEEIIIRSNIPDIVAKQTVAAFDSNNEFPPLQVYTSEQPSDKQEKQSGTSAKFKNTLQIRFFAYRFQNYVSTIFSSIGRVCMHKRQEYVQAGWRRDAADITIELGKTLTSILDVDISNDYYKSCYTLIVANVSLYALSQKDRNRELIQTSLVVSLLQNGFFEKLKDLGYGLWIKLIKMDAEEVAKSKDLKYISTIESSIVKNALSQIFMIFAKVVNSDSIPSLPSAKLFFHDGYGRDPENGLTSALLVQTRLVAFDLLKKIIGSESLLFKTPELESACNIPSPIIEQVIYIAKNVWLGRKEADVQFIPFDNRNVSPPANQVAYLISLGMSETQAEHFFKHLQNIRDLAYSKKPDCPQFDVDDETWSQYADSFKENEVDLEIDFPKFKGVKELKSLRDAENEFFSDEWLKIATYYPKSIESVADLLLLKYSNVSEIVTKIFDRIVYLVDIEKSKGDSLAVSIRLLGLLLKNERAARLNSKVFEKFIHFIIGELYNNPRAINEQYFANALSILEQILIYKDIPVSEPTEHDHISFIGQPLPYLIDNESKARIFDGILKLENITEKQSAIGLNKILVLFARDHKFARKIAQSNLLKELILLAKVFTKEKADDFEIYQSAIVVLIRRCFETPDILRVNMAAEIANLFNGSIRSKRDLQSCLRETASCVLRDPDVYVDVISKDIRLEGYDGTNDFFNSKIIVNRIKKEEREPEDVEMTDAEMTKPIDSQSQNSNIDSTGIVHTILTELMDVSKRDWVSDPKENEDEKSDPKKNSKKVDVFKNSDFAYACFLLQTITELLGSYKQPKLEFLTFSKKQNANEKLKPRSTALNFFIHQLIPTQSIIKPNGPEADRRSSVSSLAKLAILALVSTPILDEDNSPDSKKEDIDMAFIRKFYVDILSKILKETASLPTIANSRYGKLIDLFDLCGSILSPKFRELTGPLLNKNATKYDQYYIAKALIDKQIPSQIASILSDIDLNFPSINKVIRLGLKPLTLLGKIKTEFQDIFEEEHQGDEEDEDIVPEDVDDREETPDLFRNSTLGMYDVEFDSDEDEMDYYDEEGPLEVLMSGDDISDSAGSSGLSDLESDDGEEDISIDDGYEESGDSDIDNEIDGEGDEDEEVSDIDDDIEIIDELDIDSDVNSDNESINDAHDISDNSDFYDFEDDEDISEYDDEELDGWIEEFEDDSPSSNEAENEAEGDDEVERLRRSRRDNPINIDFESSSGESNQNTSDDESSSDNEFEGIPQDNNRRRSNGLPSILEIFRPERQSAGSFSALLSGFLSGGDSGMFRGSIQIDGDRRHRHHHVPPSFERAFESMLQLGTKGKHDDDPLNSMYIKSVKERWTDSMKMFYEKNRDEYIFKVIPAIVNRIEKESIELYKKKKEESERIRKERDERLRKKEEDERIRREEEAQERQLNATNNPNISHEPVMVRIGDREVDISGTDIDPEFFEALPDDMREEVFTQHIRERRANATSTGTDAREIDPDFLDALPEQIREEILQQESMARRFSGMDEMRFGEDEDEEEEDEEDEDELLRLTSTGDLGPSRRRTTETNNRSNSSKKSKRVFFTPLIERAGIASLIRLLFVPQPISQREHTHQTLLYLCHNKHSRTEIMGLLIAILHDGIVNQRSIEKFYSQISSRASGNKNSKQYQFPIGGTPILIGIQILEAVHYLLERNTHLRYYLLTEHENPFISKKVNHKSKLKESLNKENKYPINYLLRLLEKDIVKEEQSFMDILARVLQISTRPLHVLQKVNKSEDSKPAPFSPPIILDHNFCQIIKILISNDCANTTFRRTISAMQNLSVLPNAQKIFSLELSDQATKLGQTIIHDLNSLTKDIQSSINYNTENKSFAKFSAPSSDQAKLLRILTALDYMFESKEKEKDESEVVEPEEKPSVDEIEELTGLYKKLALGTLWDALSDCLRVLEGRSNLTNVATALLPLIEALMVVCKHSKVKELQIKDVVKYEVRKIDFTKEPIESLFFSFTDEHKKILNQMVRTNPNLMSGPFGMLVRNPRVLEFDNKKNYFDRKLHQDKNENSKLSVNIRRDQVFLDSYRALFFKSKDEFRNSKLEINFKGEAGVDAGGVTREWYQVLSRQMFNPDYALFSPVASDETTFHPNRTSYINPEHLSFFKFIGRIIGKAIYDNCYLDCHFSRAVYKRILGGPVSLKDMETLDLEYFKSLMWMLENDITDVITEDFSVETDDYGEHKIIDLIPNGRNIPVTEENKHEYVKKVVEYRLQTSVAEQMDNFLIGFHEIITKELVAIFDEQELELLISGLPDINVTDWQNNTVYNNYSPSSLQIQWFWRAVKSFDNEERAKLLQFATGTSKVPLNGFKELSGANGTCKFSIHRDYGSTDRLPSSHTCFNQIDLPAYESYETLRGSLLLAITEGHEGFGLA